MLHGNMQANFFLQNIENSGSMHRKICDAASNKQLLKQ